VIEITSLHGGPVHLQDGELVRLLDGELASEERSAAEAHLRACDRCRLARDRIAERTARVSGALALMDRESAPSLSAAAPAPDERSPRWLRAAAIAALIITVGALGSSTVRAWIATRWEAVHSTVARVSESAGDHGPETLGMPAVRARFVPRSSALLVRLENRPAGGVLAVETSQDDSGSVLFFAGTDEGILILPTGLVIQNAPGSRADYRLVVPRQVTSITTITGADTLAVLSSGPEGGSWRIPLAD